jgi:hypothetical protein
MKIICRKYVLYTLFYVVYKLLYIVYGAQCCDFYQIKKDWGGIVLQIFCAIVMQLRLG